MSKDGWLVDVRDLPKAEFHRYIGRLVDWLYANDGGLPFDDLPEDVRRAHDICEEWQAAYDILWGEPWDDRGPGVWPP